MAVSPLNFKTYIPPSKWYVHNNPSDYNKPVLNFPRDILEIKQANLSFQGNIEPGRTSKCEEAIKYAEAQREKILKEKPYVDLNDLDAKKLDGILDGIKVFEGLSIDDFYSFINKLRSSDDNVTMLFPLVRGCPNNCSHCLYDAKPFIEGKNEGEIGHIKWEDFTRLIDGIEEITKRLGFNPFAKDGNRRYKIPVVFFDSDPFYLKSPDDNGNTHDIADATEYIYDKLGLSSNVTIAGWDPSVPEYQEIAKKMVKLGKSGKKKPFDVVRISVNTFNEDIMKSIALKDKNAGKSNNIKQEYIDKMSNAIKTFIPLFKKGNAKLAVALYDPERYYSLKGAKINEIPVLQEYERQIIKDHGRDASYKLIDEICDNLLNKKLATKEETDLIKKNITNVFIKNNGRFLRKFKIPREETNLENRHLLDINGHLLNYVHDIEGGRLIETGIILNYDNKDKKTPKRKY